MKVSGAVIIPEIVNLQRAYHKYSYGNLSKNIVTIRVMTIDVGFGMVKGFTGHSQLIITIH
jgi:hypothetical protein